MAKRTRPAGVAVNFDPTGQINDLPTFPRGGAPAHLKTRRQLAAAGLRKGGQDVAAYLTGAAKYGVVAYLYDVRKARPQFTKTPAKQAAVFTAAHARRRCDYCGPVGYIPRGGICEDCRDHRPFQNAA